MERMERIQRTASAGAAAAPQRGSGGGRGWDRGPGGPAWDTTQSSASDRDAPHRDDFDLPAVEALRAEVGDLRARLAGAAPRRAVVEMDRAITLLHHRVEDMREAGLGSAQGGASPGGAGQGGASQEEMACLAEELLELRTSLDAMRAPERFRALSAGVEMLSRKIDLLNARTVDPVEMERLQAQSAELKALVLRAVSSSGLQPIAERLAACAEQVARTSSESAQRVAEATFLFERNAEALISRVSMYEASARSARDVATHELRRDVEADMHGIHHRLDQVSECLSSLVPAVGAELGAQLGQLIERLDESRGGEGAVGPLTAVVERHLLALTDRFQDAHARLERLDGIEAILSQMIDEMRQVSSTATQEAVDVAVDVAVEAVSRKVSADANGPAVVGLKRGLAALEARQDEVERRASELLGEALARDIEDRTVVLGRAGGDLWVPHPPAGEAFQVNENRHSDTPGQDDGDQGAGWQEPAWQEPTWQEPTWQEPTWQEPTWQEPARQESVWEEPAWPQPEERDAGEADASQPAAAEDAPRHAEAPPVEAPFAEMLEPAPRRAAYAAPQPAPEPVAAAADLGNFRPDPVAPPRPKKVTRGRSGPVEMQGAGRDARPRVDRNSLGTRRPAAARFSPAVIAMAALAVLATATAATAWTHREAIVAGASQVVSQAVTQVRVAAATPSAPLSTADLPAPTGPQALRTAALEGNLAAAYEVGVRFADGVGIPQDLDAGIKWLGYAVSRGFAPAAYRLGSLYENSLHNGDEAYRFYKWAAEQGNVRAMHNLAVLYSQGIDGTPDWGEALKWFRKAANLGLKDSQHNLGIIFARGFSGTSDLAEALTWFNIAARQGDRDSAEKRDALAREADEVVLARAKKAADAFVAKPINEAANMVAVLPEWSASEAGEHIAANTADNSVLFSGNLMASRR
ncbi:hypothetical protein [Xanthobacter sediminis]